MNKATISQNFVMPSFQTVNRNQQSTELILMDPENGSMYLLHQYYCTDSDDYRQLVALLETQAAQQTQSLYVLNPVVYLPIKYTDPNFQTSHFVQVLYQYGSHTLQQQIYLRIKQKNYFEEHQIWSILGSCVLGLKSLKDKQFSHSSICLNDIFVTKEGQIKICHPMFRTYDHLYGQTMDHKYIEKVLSENYYFAPEQLQLQNQNHYEQQTSNIKCTTTDGFFKSDIFSLGMTIISLCILHPVNDCYMKKGKKNSSGFMIQSKRLEQYFYALEQGYSPDLVGLLFSMISYHPQERVSIDQLAQIINQMIEAKREEEEKQTDQSEQYYQQSDQIHSHRRRKSQSMQSKSPGDQKFGKFSRVSQASPISSKKTKRSLNCYGLKIGYSDPDTQDRPSLVSIECQKDRQNFDKSPIDEENYAQSQLQANHQNSIHQGNQKQHIIGHVSSSIDQTLKNYINQESQLSLCEVNQTKTYEENEEMLKQKISSPLQEVVSIVMTSKQLSSLPSNSVSFVIEKRVIDSRQFDKQNQSNFSNVFASHTLNDKNMNNANEMAKSNCPKRMDHDGKAKSPSNAKSFLQMIKQQNQQTDFNEQENCSKVYPFSARPHTQINQTSRTNQKQLNPAQNKLKNNISQSNLESAFNGSMSISLNKNYQVFMKSQQKDSSNVYTDPKFLQAIREDMEKIIKKRKIQVTTSRNSVKQGDFINNQIFINGKKMSGNKPQINSFMGTVDGIIPKNIHIR